MHWKESVSGLALLPMCYCPLRKKGVCPPSSDHPFFVHGYLTSLVNRDRLKNELMAILAGTLSIKKQKHT